MYCISFLFSISHNNNTTQLIISDVVLMKSTRFAVVKSSSQETALDIKSNVRTMYD